MICPLQKLLKELVSQNSFILMNRLSNVNKSLSSGKIYDYIIVGGGISGLQSAQILTLSTKNILIIQAQNYLGGRIQSLNVTDLPNSKSADWILQQLQNFKKVKIEKGATWIQERHLVLRKICQNYKIPMKIQFSEGESTFMGDKSYTAKQLLESEVYGPQIRKFLHQIDELAQQYRVHVLDTNQVTDKYKQLLAKYDSMTLEEYLKKSIKSQKVRDFVQNFLQHTQCISADVNSMHEVLAKHGRSNDVGILKEFLGVEEHEPSYLIEGTQIIIEKYIQSIERNIKSSITSIVYHNTTVIEIDNIQNDFTCVSCTSTDGKPFKIIAKKVICAVPLQVIRNINFTSISQNKRIVFDNQLRTNAIKTFVICKKPFWRQKNKTGDGLFSYDWMVNMCHDISPQDQSCGILVFFHNGKKYYQWKSMFSVDSNNNYEQKLQYMINLVAKMFDVTEGSKQYIQNLKDCFIGQSGFMENPFIRSGFQSNTRPGTFTQVMQRGGDLTALYGDEKNIYFVGSEFSDSFASYIEGAIRIARKKVFKLINKEDPLRVQLEKVNVVTKH